MANKNYIPHADADFKEFSTNFAKQVATHQAELPVSVEESGKLTTDSTDFNDKYEIHIEAQDVAKGATANKNEAKDSLEDNIRDLAGKIQADKSVSNNLRSILGLPVHDNIHTHIHPQIPQDLYAEGSPTGVNHLNWEAGENKPGTMYVVEAMQAGEKDFSFVDVVTKTKYDHKGQTPGMMITYQIKAKRGDEVSQPSNNAVVYPHGSTE